MLPDEQLLLSVATPVSWLLSVSVHFSAADVYSGCQDVKNPVSADRPPQFQPFSVDLT